MPHMGSTSHNRDKTEDSLVLTFGFGPGTVVCEVARTNCPECLFSFICAESADLITRRRWPGHSFPIRTPTVNTFRPEPLLYYIFHPSWPGPITIHVRRHRLVFFFFLAFFPSISLTAVGRKIYQSQCAGGWQDRISHFACRPHSLRHPSVCQPEGSLVICTCQCPYDSLKNAIGRIISTIGPMLILQGSSLFLVSDCHEFFEHLRLPPRMFRTTGDDRNLRTIILWISNCSMTFLGSLSYMT